MGCAPSASANSNQVGVSENVGTHTNAKSSTSNSGSSPERNIANGRTSVETNESNNNQVKTLSKQGKPVAFEIGFEKPGAYNSLVNQPPQKFKVYNIQFSFMFSIIHCLS